MISEPPRLLTTDPEGSLVRIARGRFVQAIYGNGERAPTSIAIDDQLPLEIWFPIFDHGRKPKLIYVLDDARVVTSHAGQLTINGQAVTLDDLAGRKFDLYARLRSTT